MGISLKVCFRVARSERNPYFITCHPSLSLVCVCVVYVHNVFMCVSPFKVHKAIHAHTPSPSVTLPLFSACVVLPAASHKQTTQRSASDGFNNTHINYIDVVVIGQSLQHLADGGPDQFESQARHTSASATTTTTTKNI